MAEVPSAQAPQRRDGDITAFVETLPPPPPPPPPPLPPSPPPPTETDEKDAEGEAPKPPEMVHLFMNGADVVLPFRPYPAQIAIMNNVTQAIREGGHVLVESATGTGKTLALLAATLAARQRLLDLERAARVQHAAPKADAAPETPQEHKIEHDKTTSNSRVAISDDDDDDDDFEKPTKRARDVVPPPAATTTTGTATVVQPDAKTGKKGRGRKKDSAPAPQPRPAESVVDEGGPRGGVGRVFFCTRTHTQVAQVLKELKRLPYRVCAVTLASREMYCLNKRVQRRVDRDQACRDLAARHQCPYELGVPRLAPWIHEKRLQLDVEDLVALGRRWEACPSLVTAQLNRRSGVDVFVCPYNYVVDPLVRESLGLSLANAVVVVDEAHNLPGVLMDAMSATVDLVDLADAALAELDALVPRRPCAETLAAPVRRVLQWAHDRVAMLPATAFETHANA